MSMHAIEDLVEDTTYLVDKSSHHDLNEKRNLLFNLYSLTGYFDTSYIHFRVMDILLKNHFVYQIALAEYPQIKNLFDDRFLPADGQAGWAYNEQETILGYATHKNGIIHLYCNAGDTFWELLCQLNILPAAEHQPPQQRLIVETITAIMLEAERQQEAMLLKQWYNLFVNGILQFVFTNWEGIPQTFTNLLADDRYIQLRSIAQRNQLDKQRVTKDEDDYLAFPNLKDELDAPTDIMGMERTYIIRYLLQLSKSPEQLQASYQKDILAIEKGLEKVKLIHKIISPYLTGLNWQYAELEQNKTWLWYKDLNDEKYQGPGHRLFIMLDLDIEKKVLLCKQALQHSLILRWQAKQPSILPENWHFYYDIVGWLPDEFSKKKQTP